MNSTISENSTFDFKRLGSFELMPYIVLNTFGILAGLFGNNNINNNNNNNEFGLLITIF